MFYIVLFVMLIIAVPLIIWLKNKKDNYNTYNIEDDYTPFNLDTIHNTNQSEYVSGKIETPIKVNRTLVKNYPEQNGLITASKCMYDVEEFFADLAPLPYRQYHTYKLKGKNTATNRMKTISIDAYNEYDAIQKAKKIGFTEPFEILLDDAFATVRQKDFLRNLHLTVKSNYTIEDASCIISRTHEKESAPEKWLLEFADTNNIPFSLYATNTNVIRHIEKEYFTDIVKELSFWVYVVNRFTNKSEYFDKIRFETIAKQLSSDTKFMRLYKQNVLESKINYISPNTRTTVYKMAVEMLNKD